MPCHKTRQDEEKPGSGRGRTGTERRKKAPQTIKGNRAGPGAGGCCEAVARGRGRGAAAEDGRGEHRKRVDELRERKK